MGIVSIKWPYDDAEQYEGLMADIRSAIQIARDYGMDHRFTSSSSFIEWRCDQEIAIKIKTEIESQFIKLEVKWREK